MGYKTVLTCFAIYPFAISHNIYGHIKDHMDGGDKDKLRSLAHELVAEAKYRIHQTDVVRDALWNEVGFHIGMIMGQIREKYKTMLEIYRQTRNKFTGKSKIMTPAIPYMRSIHYFMRMEFISALEIDIDRLVHVIETIPEHLLKIELPGIGDIPPEFYKRKSSPPTPKPRAGQESEEEFEALKSRLAEKTKSENRQKYLMKKLGLPANSSIDDAWSLNRNLY